MAKDYQMIGVKKELHKQVKVVCAKEGRTISGLVTELLQEYIAKANKEG